MELHEGGGIASGCQPCPGKRVLRSSAFTDNRGGARVAVHQPPLLLEFIPTPALATMRIAQLIRALIAVLGLAAVFNPVSASDHFNDTLSESRPRRSSRKHHHNNYGDWHLNYTHSVALEAGRWLSPRENQMLLKQEFKTRPEAECCPSVLEMVEPEGGKNQDDQYVELYRDGNNRQRFYELSCHKDVLQKPCRFMDRKLHTRSRCVQKYSYTYALVKDPGRHHHHQRPNYFPSFPATGPGGSMWTLDYIRVRSGCSCVVLPNKKKKRDKGEKRAKNDDSAL